MRGLIAKSAPGRRISAALAAALLLPGATGCYTYAPVWSGVPAQGSEVRVGLTDRGRVALAPSLGPGALRVTGKLAGVTDSAYSVGVNSVVYLDGAAPAKWNGEPVTISRDYVGVVAERRLSKTRTWIAVGAVAGIAVLASRIAINGFGGDVGDTKAGGGGPQTQ